MSCDFSRERLIEYLYQEGSEENIRSVASHVQDCEACKAIVEELRTTSAFLQHWPDEQPNLNLSFVRDQRQGSFAVISSALKRWRFSAGVAAGIAASLLLLALMNFEAHYENDKMSLRIGLVGEQIQAEDAVSRAEFQKWQIQSIKLMDQMLRESEQQQSLAVQEALATLSESWKQQRRYDLQRVGEGLEVFQLANQSKFRESQQLMEQLARSINVKRDQ